MAGAPAKVLHNYKAASEDELDLTAGQIILVHSQDPSGWWWGAERDSEANGFFPSGFVELLQSTQPAISSSQQASKPVASSSLATCQSHPVQMQYSGQQCAPLCSQSPCNSMAACAPQTPSHFEMAGPCTPAINTLPATPSTLLGGLVHAPGPGHACHLALPATAAAHAAAHAAATGPPACGVPACGPAALGASTAGGLTAEAVQLAAVYVACLKREMAQMEASHAVEVEALRQANKEATQKLQRTQELVVQEDGMHTKVALLDRLQAAEDMVAGLSEENGLLRRRADLYMKMRQLTANDGTPDNLWRV